MVSTYTDNFGIEKMASGDQSGAWGNTTNFNLDIVDRIASALAVALTGTTHTLTVETGSPSSGASNVQDGMYRVVNFTGTPGGTCTVTIAPATTKAFFIIKNSTDQSVIMTQASSNTVTIVSGYSAIIYCDGAAEVYNAVASMSFTALGVTDGFDAQKEDSGTTTVISPLSVTRTSSGTPGTGIGAGIDIVTETSAGNNEIGTSIQSISTDVTGGNEDFDLVFKNMASGSAATEVARITSAGVTTVGGNFSATGSVSATAGVSSSIEDSGTTTVINPLTLPRTSSATPAAGIGAGIAFVVETTAGNNETGVTLEAVTTDISSTSEDFDLTFNLMAAGAAAAEKMRLESTGYLGIGVTNPSVQLHIAKSAVADIGTLTSATSITPDFAANQNFTVTLAHNAALENPSNPVAGQTGSIFVVQDGTGSRTMSYGTYWDFIGGTAPTLSTAAAAIDRIDYIIQDATNIQAILSAEYS